jgi:2,3-bisphosphoglycerate-dependent phosphoglycerate mutase
MVNKIYLMRHTESIATRDRSLFQKMDPRKIPLTEWGWRQAKDAGAVLAKDCNASQAFIFINPLDRICDTAEGIKATFKKYGIDAKIQIAPLLEQQKFGVMDAKSPEDVSEEDKKTLHKGFYGSFSERFNTRIPQGESAADIRKRMESFLKELQTQIPAEATVIIICHGTHIALLEDLLLGRTEQYYDTHGIVDYGRGIIKKIELDLSQYGQKAAAHSQEFYVAEKRSKYFPHDYLSNDYRPKRNQDEPSLHVDNSFAGRLIKEKRLNDNNLSVVA